MSTTPNTLADYDAALDTLRARGLAVRALLAECRADRRWRAATVNVVWAAARDNGDRIVASVRGSALYEVTITLGAVGFNCTCPDHNRTGPCKHVVAVANRYLVKYARPEWTRLTEGRAALVAALDAVSDEGEDEGWEDPHPEDRAEAIALARAEFGPLY